jgi:ribonuclease HII
MMKLFDRDLIPSSPDLSYELPLWEYGWCAAGLDEAGRGAWAGPVMAAVVILPIDKGILTRLAGVRDSKQLKLTDRARLSKIIQSETTWAVGSASNLEIDEIGILPATRLAMMRALEQLEVAYNCLLLDALFLPEVSLPQISLIKGDQRSLSISAASILAKTHRDALMIDYDNQYPNYGFARHKGYGTSGHQESLSLFGKCGIHRLSFQPIKNLGK